MHIKRIFESLFWLVDLEEVNYTKLHIPLAKVLRIKAVELDFSMSWSLRAIQCLANCFAYELFINVSFVVDVYKNRDFTLNDAFSCYSCILLKFVNCRLSWV